MYGDLPTDVHDLNKSSVPAQRVRNGRNPLVFVLAVVLLCIFAFSSPGPRVAGQAPGYYASEDLAEKQSAADGAFEAQFSEKAQELRRWKWRAEPDASLLRVVESLAQDDLHTREWLLATRPHAQRGTPIGLTASQLPHRIIEGKAALQHSTLPRKGDGPGEFAGGSWEKYGELLHEWHDGQQPFAADGQAWYEPYARLHAEIMSGKRDGGVLEYWCQDGEVCGGLADRMLGMTTTFLYALLSDRAFTASWDHPFPLDLLFDSPSVDWSSPSPTLAHEALPAAAHPAIWSNETLLRRRTRIPAHNFDAKQGDRILEELTTATELSSEPWLRLDRPNRGLTLHTFQTSAHLARLSSLGLTMHTAYAQLVHFLFRPKLEALLFIAEYVSVFALPSVFVVGIQVRTGDRYMRDSKEDQVNTVERHAHWFQCAQEVVETYSHPSQRPLYFLLTDSPTLRSSAATAHPDRVVTSGLAQRHAEMRDERLQLVGGAGRTRAETGGVEEELDGMMGTVAESWAFSSVDFALLSDSSGFGKIPTYMHAKPGRAIVVPRVGERRRPRKVRMGSCRLESALADFEELGKNWSLG